MSNEKLNNDSLKICLLGDGAVGKTTYVNRHKTGVFRQGYHPTQTIEIVELVLTTNYGVVMLEIWDTAGQERYGGLRDIYYLSSDGGLLMFDLTQKATLMHLPNWYEDFKRAAPGAPVVVVGNKLDIREQRLAPAKITWPRQRHLQYYEISSRANIHTHEPLRYLCREILGLADLEFQGEVAKPPEFELPQDIIEEAERRIAIANNSANVFAFSSAQEFDDPV